MEVHILFLILLSFKGIIQFYSKSFWIGFGNIRIDLNALFLLVTHLIFNKEIIHETQDLFKDNEVDKVESKEALINNFQKKFALKKRVELERIIEENQLIPEALEAAKRLLKEK